MRAAVAHMIGAGAHMVGAVAHMIAALAHRQLFTHGVYIRIYTNLHL